MGYTTLLPNSYGDAGAEVRHHEMGKEVHAKWKGEKLRESEKKIQEVDAILVLNFEKNGVPNYIGGATFLEMYDGFRMGKKIYLYNEIPEGMLKDEILAFDPIIIYQDISQIR